MAIADFINELSSHQFTDLLHFRVTQPGLVSNAKATSIMESEAALDRKMTAQEESWLGTLVAKLEAPPPAAPGFFTARDFEAAARLLEANWITQAEFLLLLGL